MNIETNAGRFRVAQRQVVMQRNSLKDRAEFVIGVRALAENVQPQIDFRKGWDSDFAHALLRLSFLRRRFLGYTMLGLAELLLDFSDFVVFDIGGPKIAPFWKGVFPLGRGQFIGGGIVGNGDRGRGS